MDDSDREIDNIRRQPDLNPHVAAMITRHRRRDNDLEGGVFSTRVEADVSDMIKRQGYFEQPNHYTDWEVYRKRLEKLFRGEKPPILEDRWGKLLPQFLRGKARAHIESKEDIEGRDLTYAEMNELLNRLLGYRISVPGLQRNFIANSSGMMRE